jgi:cytoskeletal protein CcmA (bactofilin family)
MVEKGNGSITMLGAGASFEGKITTPHMVHVFGKFSGEIHSSDIVAVGRDGSITANITAKSVQIGGGKVHGNIICKELLELGEHSEVRGNITAKELIIKKSAVFHGNSNMSQNSESGKNDKQINLPSTPPSSNTTVKLEQSLS